MPLKSCLHRSSDLPSTVTYSSHQQRHSKDPCSRSWSSTTNSVNKAVLHWYHSAIIVLWQKSSLSSQKGKEFSWSFCCPRGSEFQIVLQFPLVMIHHKWTAKTSVDNKAMETGTSTSGDSEEKAEKAGPLPSCESPSFPLCCFCF